MDLETILFCSIFGLFIMATYTLGLRNGQKLSKKEEIQMPNINPVEIYHDSKIKKEIVKKQEQFDTVMSNLEKYDGTSLNQEDIPN